MHKIFWALIVIGGVLLADDQTESVDSTMYIITTTDGVDYIGNLVEESEESLTIKTVAGLEINIPVSAILVKKQFAGRAKEGEVWLADPNKTMYLFAPSAYPIGHSNRYCRDFCLIFPSYNFGVNPYTSVQLGAFWFPGVPLENVPFVGSMKYSLSGSLNFSLALGAMYISIPMDDERFGTGFVFSAATFGDEFTHATAAVGFGYAQHEGEWEFMDRPILVLACNIRSSSRIAYVGEAWIIPEIGFSEGTPLMAAGRFIGKRISVDLGGMLFVGMEGMPVPLINFTYHMD